MTEGAHEVIHGLVDVAVFKNWWIRALAVTFELICPCFVVYQLCPRTRKYLRKHFEDPGDFQELTILFYCNRRKSFCKMKPLSLLHYLMSLEIRGYVQTIEDQQWTTVEERAQMRVDLFSYLLKMNMTPSDLELSLSANFDDIILAERHAPIKNKLKHVTADGACYSFDFDIQPSAVLKQSTRFDFRINRTWYLLWKVDNTIGIGVDSDALFLGNLGYFVQKPAHAINQGSGKPTQLSSGGSKKGKSVFQAGKSSLATLSHLDHSREGSLRHSVFSSFNQQFCSTLAKPFYIPLGNETMDQAEQLCSWFDGNSLTDMRHCVGFPEVWYGADTKLDDLCNRQCPPLCEETVYYVTRGREELRELVEPNYSRVELRFEGPSSQFGLIEKQEFSSLSFACEIGSVVALWTGSTLINIGRLLFHGIQFLVCGDKK